MEELKASGLPFGMIEGAQYDELAVGLEAGDRLLLFSDGVVEVKDMNGEMLGADGLVRILQRMGYPRTGVSLDALQTEILTLSAGIRLADDLTIMEIALGA